MTTIMGRLIHVCRTHFYKVLVLIIIALMALQYGLSTTFYGGKSYFYVAIPMFYPTSGKVTESYSSNNDIEQHASSVTGAPIAGPGSLNSKDSSSNINSSNRPLVVENPPKTNAANLTVAVQNGTPTTNIVPANRQQHLRNTTVATLPVNSTKVTDSASSNGGVAVTVAELPLCPALPPKLVGPIKVLTEAPSFEELEAMFPELEPGGRFRPADCKSRSRVAIIIPYRDREMHLRLFLHNLHPVLQRQQLDYGIYVVEEAGNTKFNRAMLMNIGYAEALKLYDYQCFIFHDVDLLPEDDRNIYSCPEQPRHMSVAVNTMGYKLPYSDIFGGVSALTKEQMKKVNGFSNEFWGWGGEDDDMSSRIRYHGYKITRYSDKIARYTMMKHIKDKPNPDRYNKLYKGKERYSSDGVNSLKYERVELLLKKLYTWVYVKLEQPK